MAKWEAKYDYVYHDEDGGFTRTRKVEIIEADSIEAAEIKAKSLHQEQVYIGGDSSEGTLISLERIFDL